MALGIRMRQHEKNAAAVAGFLASHPNVKKAMYPGLKSFEGYETARRQMEGFGAMLSFEIVGGLEKSKKEYKR